MLKTEVDTLIEQVIRWAEEEKNIQAIGLVGSWARGSARDDSDVDLVILTDKPEKYLSDHQWISNFGTVKTISDEDWGAVQSKRVFLEDGLEVEFGISTEDWARTEPIDQGTANVVRDGMKIILDKKGILGKLEDVLSSKNKR